MLSKKSLNSILLLFNFLKQNICLSIAEINKNKKSTLRLLEPTMVCVCVN